MQDCNASCNVLDEEDYKCVGAPAGGGVQGPYIPLGGEDYYYYLFFKISASML